MLSALWSDLGVALLSEGILVWGSVAHCKPSGFAGRTTPRGPGSQGGVGLALHYKALAWCHSLGADAAAGRLAASGAVCSAVGRCLAGPGFCSNLASTGLRCGAECDLVVSLLRKANLGGVRTPWEITGSAFVV